MQIAEAYRRKIEAIVRKPSGAGRGGEEEEQDLLSPCPHCGCRSPATSLECSQCLGRIPYCIVTGMRMVSHDWTICPSCRFPALYSKFLSVITAEKVLIARSRSRQKVYFWCIPASDSLDLYSATYYIWKFSLHSVFFLA